MLLRRTSIALAAGALALALPAATTSYARGVSGSFIVNGVVPTICRVDFNTSAAPIAGQIIDLGTMTELCNDTQGYQVTLVTPPGLTGSAAIVDGTTIPLAANGLTVIVDSNTDAFRHRNLKIQLASDAAPFAKVAFTTTPKGTVF